MPANPKYLTLSTGQQIVKFILSFFGSYLVATTFHLAVAAWSNKAITTITMSFTALILWVVLMIVAFLIKTNKQLALSYFGLTVFFFAVLKLGI